MINHYYIDCLYDYNYSSQFDTFMRGLFNFTLSFYVTLCARPEQGRWVGGLIVICGT